MVYTNVIYQAVEDVALTKTDWISAFSIKAEVEEKAEQSVSTKKIGWYLGRVAKSNHFRTRKSQLRGKEYLPRVLLFGRV